MPKIYIVVGHTRDPMRVWPISYAVDLEPCKALQAACEGQAKALADALTVVWNKTEKLKTPDEYVRFGRSARSGKAYRNRDYENQLTAFRKDQEKLEAEEHAIRKQFGDVMIDALFPMGDTGWLPEVEYVVWAVGESLRDDFLPSELLLLRAKLHATEDSDSLPPDESDDED